MKRRAVAPLPLLLLWATASCGGETAPRPAARALPARAVHVARAERAPRPTIEEVVGTVRARHRATLAPTLSGKVAEVRVTVGSEVRAGDVLVRLSAREIDARLEQARAVHALAKLELERATRLRAEDAIAPAQLDAARSRYRVAEAAQAEARTLADHAVLRAPFAGVVTEKRVSAGDTAMPGQPLLVLEMPGDLRFEARVPEAAARALALGQPARVRVDGIDHEVGGTVGEIDPAADAATRTLRVKIDLAPDPALRSGRFGRLLLATGASDTVTVARSAVLQRGQLEAVFVIEAGVARLRLVRTGRADDGRIEIVSGLDGGEEVAASGAAQLVDGQPVEVQL